MCVPVMMYVIAPRLGCAVIVASLMHAAVSMYLRTNILYVCMWGYVTLQRMSKVEFVKVAVNL